MMRSALAAFALSAILHPMVRVRDTQGIERLPLKVEHGKVEALFFVAHDCPISNYYSREIRRICEDYASRGFEVLGFPCNQFMGQEPGTADEIREFCSTTYGVAFPIFEKIDVNGDQQHPIFAELEQTADADGEAGDVKWNFEKFLLSPSGEVVGRFRPQVTPEDPALVSAIEAQLPS